MSSNDPGKGATFDHYEVTTNDPGFFLLGVTVVTCIAIFVVGSLVLPGGTFHSFYTNLMSNLRSKFSREKDLEEDEEAGLSYYIGTGGTASSTPGAVKTTPERSRPSLAKTEVTTRKGPRGKKRKTATSLRNLCTITVNQNKGRATITLKNPKQHAVRPSSALSNVLDPGTRPDRSSVSTDDRLGFVDLASFFDEQKPAKPKATSSNGSATTDSTNASLEEHFLDNQSVTSKSVKSTASSFLEDTTMWAEVKTIMEWASPWILQSVISYGEDIINIVLISHFLGLGAMIAYSHIWFIIGILHLLTDAWYNAVYRHVNIYCGLETVEGYIKAGKTVQIGMIGNFIVSLPSSVLAVIFMPSLLQLLGYDQEIVVLAKGYTIIAVINSLLSSTSDILHMVLDLEGYAKMTTVFEFWESLISLLATFIYVAIFRPSLLGLGLFHLILEIVATVIFFYTAFDRGYYKVFEDGILAPMTSVNSAQVRALVKVSIPLVGEEIVGSIEDITFTTFAAYQGTAEAATWILMSYVWAFVDLAPESFAEAASSRIERHLSRQRKKFAQDVSVHFIKAGSLMSIACSIVLYMYGPFFVWCLSLDDTLEQMLLEIIPYIVICQPFVSIGMITMELNDALHIYKKSAIVMTFATLVIMIPFAAIMTYVFHYNIEGLAAAQCIGYTAAGVANIVIFMNADWDRAVKKAQLDDEQCTTL